MTNINYYIYNLINKYKPILLVLFYSLPLITTAQNIQEIQLANEYLIKGDKVKALELYRELAKSDNNIPTIHNNYFNV